MPQSGEGLTIRTGSAAESNLGNSEWANGWDVAVEGLSVLRTFYPKPRPGRRRIRYGLTPSF